MQVMFKWLKTVVMIHKINFSIILLIQSKELTVVTEYNFMQIQLPIKFTHVIKPLHLLHTNVGNKEHLVMILVKQLSLKI